MLGSNRYADEIELKYNRNWKIIKKRSIHGLRLSVFRIGWLNSIGWVWHTWHTNRTEIVSSMISRWICRRHCSKHTITPFSFRSWRAETNGGVNATVKQQRREKNKSIGISRMHVELNQYHRESLWPRHATGENERKRSNFLLLLLFVVVDIVASERGSNIWIMIGLAVHWQTHLPYYHIDYGNEGTI